MGSRVVRSTKTLVVAVVICMALIGSAVLAYASTKPTGRLVESSGGTTTTTVLVTSTTLAASTTTTTVSSGCKPGHGYGDTHHCHSGPPGQAKSHHANRGHHH